MPSGTDFKYSTGDTTAWKNKYYAFVDYALSVGASVADIEAFLAENSSFTPGTAPTALASLNAATATTSDNLEYQITHGTPYTALTADLWFLVRMPSTNAGSMTLKVDSLAAKSVYVGGVATAGGELVAGGVYLLSYNTTEDRFDLSGAGAADVKSVAIDHTDSVYTVLSSNLGLVHTVSVDISAGDVDVKELALGSMSGIVRIAITGWDGAGAIHKARFLDSSDQEVWTGFASGDFIECVYDGTTRTILAEGVTAFGFITLDADYNRSTSEGNLWPGSSSTLHENCGALFDYTTNYRIDLPFPCLIRLYGRVAKDDTQNAYFRVYDDGSNVLIDCDEGMDSFFERVIKADGTDYLNLRNAGNGGTVTFRGDGSVGETYNGWEVIKRLRP